MYGKEEAYELRKLFWTSFGKFMKRHKSADFTKVNWMNYKTGVKDLYFRLEADKRTAKICVDLQMADADIREIYYAQFKEVRGVFHDLTGIEWDWNDNYINEYNVTLGRLSISIDKVNMYNKDNWQTIFEFYEKYLIGMDEFWIEFKDLFKQLE